MPGSLPLDALRANATTQALLALLQNMQGNQGGLTGNGILTPQPNFNYDPTANNPYFQNPGSGYGGQSVAPFNFPSPTTTPTGGTSPSSPGPVLKNPAQVPGGTHAGGANGQGGSGQPGVGITPANGAQFGDPNSDIGQAAFMALNALNPLSPLLTVPVTIASMVDSDVQAPPSLAGMIAGMVNSPTQAQQNAQAQQSAMQFGEVAGVGSPAQSDAEGQAQAQANNAQTVSTAISAAGSPTGHGTGGAGTVGSVGGTVGTSGQGTSTGGSGKGGVGNGGGSASAPSSAVGTTGQGSSTGGQGQGGVAGIGHGSGGGGGGGGGGKIICTECARQGYLPKELIAKDDEYAAILRQTRPGVYEGYRIWADYVVRAMRKSPRFTKFISPVVIACAKEMGRRANGEKGPWLIRNAVTAGENICLVLYRLGECASSLEDAAW